MSRRQLIEQIGKRLGTRKLVWFGTRGTDSQPLLQLSQFSEVYSIVAPLEALTVHGEVCLEALTGTRVDLDAYSIDYDHTPPARELLRRLYQSLGEPAVVAMYRPGAFFTSIYYPRSEFVEYLGQFHERQAPFEHKPWVESELRKRGVQVVPWRYFGDSERPRLQDILEREALVLRTSRSDGGVGLAHIQSPEELDARWPSHEDHFLSAAPFLSPNIPLNVNACVFRGGEVSLHAPSLQLIGLPGFTSRKFGYCGNDFARIRELDAHVLDAFEEAVVESGKWLANKGYLGAFGVDALLYHGEVYLTEINPRFQGSSHLSAVMDMDLDRADMFLEHIAAFLGLEPPPFVPLKILAGEQRKVSQVVCHNQRQQPVRTTAHVAPEAEHVTCTLLPRCGVVVDPEAILFRAVIDGSVTQDGLSLHTEYEEYLKTLVESLFDTVSGSEAREE